MVQDIRTTTDPMIESTLLNMEDITRTPLTRESATQFLDYLNSSPALKDDARTHELMETFEIQLHKINNTWAKEKLAELESFKQARGMLAGEVDQNHTNTVSAGTPKNGDSLLGEKSLATIEISPQDAYKLGEEIIGKPLTKENILAYQTKQNLLPADGVIGAHTYLEMRVPELTAKVNHRIDTLGISSKTQAEVLDFIAKANLKGTNAQALLASLTAFKLKHGSESDFTKKYGDFYDGVFGGMQKEDGGAGTPKALEETKGSNGKTLWENAKEGNIEEILKNPTLLLAAGALFLFGVIGGDTKYTDGIFKRIGWIFGGMIMGPKIWFELVGPALADGKEYLRSPEAQTVVAGATSDAENIFKKAYTWTGDQFTEAWAYISGTYTDTLKSFESKNDAQKTAGVDGKPSEKYVDKFTEKWSAISSDETFLTIPIASITGITDKSKAGLAKLISPETLTTLNLYGFEDKDAKNLIDDYILPQIADARGKGIDVQKFGDTYLSVRLLEGAQNLISDVKKDLLGEKLVETDTLSSKLRDELSFMMNSTKSTPDAKKAANDLARALINNTPSSFNIDLYPGLTVGTGSEREILESIVENYTLITGREADLKRFESEVQLVHSDVSSVDDPVIKKQLLEQQWNILQGIKVGYTNDRPRIVEPILGSPVTTYNLDSALAQKEKELLDVAQNIGLSTLGTAAVGTALTEAQQASSISENVTKFQEALAKLEDLPAPTATPLKLKEWYEGNKDYFKLAKDFGQVPITPTPGSNETLIANAQKKILERKEGFVEIYKAKRGEYVGNLLRIGDAVRKIDLSQTDGSNFEDTQKRFEVLSQEYNNLVGNAIDSSYLSEVYGLYDWISGNVKYTITDTNNAFTFIEAPENLNINDPVEFTPNFSAVESDLNAKTKEIKNRLDTIIKEQIEKQPLNQITQDQFSDILAPLDLKPELLESFTEVIQNRDNKTIKDFLDVYNESIGAMTKVGDEESRKILEASKVLFLERINGGLTLEIKDWIEKAYGNIDAYYQTLL